VDTKKRKEEILGLITEFGAKLAIQPEVTEAVCSDEPLWERLSVSDMVLAFEEAIRGNLPLPQENEPALRGSCPDSPTAGGTTLRW
jgi:hypothetical protein